MAHADAHPHRRPRRHRRGRLLLGALVCLGLLAAGAAVAIPRMADDETSGAGPSTCDPTTVELTVDPRLATLVKQATVDLGPWLDDDECLAVDVSSRDSATTAAEIARPPGQGMSSTLPDLWIPDSTVWLRVVGATSVGAGRIADGATSVAGTPVVIAMPRSRAEAAGWPNRQPSWRGLFHDATSPQLATTDVDADAAGLLTLDALNPSRSPARLAALSSRLSQPLLGDETPARLVAHGDADAIPTTEQDVLATNQDMPDTDQVVAAYDPALQGRTLDFPLVALSPPDAGHAEVVDRAADVLRQALLDPATQQLFTTAGFRDARGGLAESFGALQGVMTDPAQAGATPPTDRITSLRSAWASSGRRSRLLVVVDRSGSMAETLPGSTSTRAGLAQASLRTVVEGTAPDSDLGLWSFTTDLPTGDWQTLVPTGRLDAAVNGATRRTRLLEAVDTLDPKIGGGTPLYDAIAAAYRAASRNYSYGRLNAVIVVTDGRNEDAESISLPTLLDGLKVQYDGVQPVRLIAIAYGPGVDTATLRRITEVTGGRTYHAVTASDVDGVFAQVLANL